MKPSHLPHSDVPHSDVPYSGFPYSGFPAIILAGGQSLRMGQDKALMQMGPVRMIDHVYSRLKTQVSQIYISGPQDYGLALPIIKDATNAPKGPVGGLYSIWKYILGEKQAGFFTVPVDGPNLPADFCSKISGQTCAISATGEALHPTFAFWTVQALSKAFADINLSESISLKYLAHKCQARHVNWTNSNGFYNINTPQELETYAKHFTV